MKYEDLIKTMSWNNTWDYILKEYKPKFDQEDPDWFFEWISSNSVYDDLVGIWDLIKFNWITIQNKLYKYSEQSHCKRLCPNCGLILNRQFISHLKRCANLSDQEYTNLLLFNDKNKIPKCIICGKDAYYNKGHYGYYSTCNLGNCAKIYSSRTRVLSGEHPFLSKNRLVIDGKDIMSVKANKTKVELGIHNFQHQNRTFDKDRIKTNYRKYGTNSPTNFWYRTEYNNGSEFNITDEEIKAHNKSVTESRLINCQNNLWIGSYRSIGEFIVEDLLKELNLKYIIQYYSDKWNHKYTSDFYLPDYNLLIEIDGDWKYDEDWNLGDYWIEKYNIYKSTGFNLLTILHSDTFKLTKESLMNKITQSDQLSN